MTAINGVTAPDPPKDEKLTEPTGKRVIAWVRLGPAWWPTASNLDPTPSEVA